jgi:hypothetical protein
VRPLHPFPLFCLLLSLWLTPPPSSPVSKIIEKKQMQDFMKLYSGLVERCFNSCVNDFTSKTLTGKEVRHSPSLLLSPCPLLNDRHPRTPASCTARTSSLSTLSASARGSQSTSASHCSPFLSLHFIDMSFCSFSLSIARRRCRDRSRTLYNYIQKRNCLRRDTAMHSSLVHSLSGRRHYDARPELPAGTPRLLSDRVDLFARNLASPLAPSVTVDALRRGQLLRANNLDPSSSRIVGFEPACQGLALTMDRTYLASFLT